LSAQENDRPTRNRRTRHKRRSLGQHLEQGRDDGIALILTEVSRPRPTLSSCGRENGPLLHSAVHQITIRPPEEFATAVKVCFQSTPILPWIDHV
jgi:hypothetical protein